MKAPSAVFDQDHAAAYDRRFAKLAPQRDSLHLLIRILFGELPHDARILCVGAGTGAEVIALAAAFPGFHFTAVEPSLPMLEVCRQKAAQAGIDSRCTFHHGYIHTLPTGAPFHAATSLLVSQFLTDRTARISFFEEIANRLVPAGLLVDADLSADLDSPDATEMKDVWRRMLIYSDTAPEHAAKFADAWKQAVGVLPPHEVAAIISDGGFGRPTLFYQSLFIHGWFARRK